MGDTNTGEDQSWKRGNFAWWMTTLREKIFSLPEDDKNDCLELLPIIFYDDREESQAALNTLEEILFPSDHLQGYYASVRLTTLREKIFSLPEDVKIDFLELLPYLFDDDKEESQAVLHDLELLLFERSSYYL